MIGKEIIFSGFITIANRGITAEIVNTSKAALNNINRNNKFR